MMNHALLMTLQSKDSMAIVGHTIGQVERGLGRRGDY